MRLLIMTALFATLCVLDAATTLYLFEHFPEGRELNPYVDPGSWAGLLFVPVKFVVYAAFVLCLILAERKSADILAENGMISNAAMLAYFPIFLIFVEVLAVFNNLMPMLGISTPGSYALAWMRVLPGSESLHYSLLWSLLFLALAPLGLALVKRIYGADVVGRA